MTSRDQYRAVPERDFLAELVLLVVVAAASAGVTVFLPEWAVRVAVYAGLSYVVNGWIRKRIGWPWE